MGGGPSIVSLTAYSAVKVTIDAWRLRDARRFTDS